MIAKKMICAFLAASVALSGCGAITNPYVRAKAIDRPLTAPDREFSDRFVGDLPKAIDDAGEQVLVYVEAAADHSRFRTSSLILLLPLTALALYKGITADTPNRKNLTALGLVSGSIYFGGSLFYSETRQRVYLEGARAVQCAIATTRPYLMTKEDYTGLTGGEKKIRDAIPAVSLAIRALQREEASGDTDPEWHKRIMAETRNAERLLSRANTALRNTKIYLNNVDRAGSILRDNVKEIILEVDAEVQKTEPNWAALAGLRAGVVSAAGQFGQVPATATGSSSAALPDAKAPLEGGQQSRRTRTKEQLAKEAAARAKAENEKRERKKALQAALQVLADASQKLAIEVNFQFVSLNGLSDLKKSTTEALKSCEPAETRIAFRINPDVAEITLTPGVGASFVAVSPKSSTTLAAHGTAASRLEIKPTGMETLTEGRTTTVVTQFLVSVKDGGDAAGASGGDADLEFSDGRGNTRSVHVIIGQAAPKPEVKKPEEKPAPPAVAAAVKDPKVLCVQTKLAEQGFTSSGIDGILGPNTRGDIRKFSEKKGLTPTEEVSAEVLAALGCAQ